MSYLIGGKGCNQAVAASRLGNNVKMIGCVGKDSFSDEILKNLEKEGVSIDGIKNGALAHGISNGLSIDKAITFSGVAASL